MKLPRLLAPALAAALVAASSPTRAAAAAPLQPPADAIAWWRLDPSRFTAAQGQLAQRQAALSALRAVVASHLVPDEQGARLLAGALAAAEVGAAAHLLALRDFHAVRPPTGSGMDLRSIDMTLVLGAGADHRSALRSLRAILLSDAAQRADAPAGEQRAVALADGSAGVAFRPSGAPSWRELAWTSRNGAFLIALGENALARWVASEQQPQPGEPPWLAHRALVAAARPAGEVFFEAWLDLDALRARFPDAFVAGRTPRALRALGLEGASQLMLHGRWIDPPPGAAHPPLLALDATWLQGEGADAITPRPFDDRADHPRPPPALHRLALTLDRWPAALTQPPPQGSFAVVVPVDWPRITALVLDVLEATRRDSRMARFQAIRARWASLTDEARQRLFAALTPYVVVSDDPAPLLAVPGAASVFVELKAGASAEAALEELALLLSPIRDRLGHDAETQLWWTRLDRTGLVRAPVWGAATNSRLSLLVVGWSERAVLAARHRLREQPAR